MSGDFRLFSSRTLPASRDGGISAVECETGDQRAPRGLVVAHRAWFRVPADRRPPPAMHILMHVGMTFPDELAMRELRLLVDRGDAVVLAYVADADLENAIAAISRIPLHPRARQAAQDAITPPDTAATDALVRLRNWAMMADLCVVDFPQEEARAVLVAMADTADPRGHCAMTADAIESVTGIDAGRVRVALAALEVAGLARSPWAPMGPHFYILIGPPDPPP